MRKQIVVAGFLAAVLVAGCERDDGRKMPTAEEFEIPRSLVTRMLDAHDRVRDRFLNTTNDFDSSELYSLVAVDMTNAEEIARRPRGRMKFCDDLLTNEERENMWPFDFEKFEAELESKLELSEEFGFRVKPEFATLVNGGVNDDGYVASNPTIQWVNAEIESWAIKAWDEQKDRLDDAQLRKLLGVEEVPAGIVAWMVNEEMTFVIRQCDGAWNRRDYMFVSCEDGESTGIVFTFDSFPNRKAAAAIFQLQASAAGFNNVAVMMWEHQCDRLQMDPEIIKFFLEKAIRGGAPNATENLDVLRAHIPEVFQDEMVELPGTPYALEPENAKLLHEVDDLALFAGETESDIAFNKSNEGLRRNSLFMRRRLETGREEWRLIMTAEGDWKLAEGRNKWCEDRASDARKDFEVMKAILSKNRRSIWMVCDPHIGTYYLVCRYDFDDNTFRVICDGDSAEEQPDGTIKITGRKTYLSDENGEPLGAAWYDEWIDSEGRVIRKSEPVTAQQMQDEWKGDSETEEPTTN